MKGNCFIDIEEERQKIKDLLFILEKFNVSESAYRELTVFSTTNISGFPSPSCKNFISPPIKISKSKCFPSTSILAFSYNVFIV
jgi:hypothetical protein